ncbi:unnamed protein product [Eruca vesicaria subsp. sativa]|uniref:Uncharacterized protein n=1 Tax=Eruca vesicaria subsp. sativa TaxID=29727 RepID=A0ABC8J3C9_ERUVS|nr:unnamed protein product [Eruca vesicaria subsp. sativa]
MGWFSGDEGYPRSVVLSFLREVEAHSDPSSPVLANGKGRLIQLRFRRLWFRRVEAHKAPRCRFGTRYSLGFGSSSRSVNRGLVLVVTALVDEFSFVDEALRRRR